MNRLGSMSLERKLPLLMTAVLAIVLATAVTITYRTLRESAEAAVRERMMRGAQSVTGNVQEALTARLSRMRELAGGPVVRALRARDTAAIRRILAEYRGADTSTMEVWDSRGAPVLTLGTPISAEERRAAARAWAAASPVESSERDTTLASPLYEWAGRVHFWFVAPVTDGNARLGFVAHRRRLTGSAAFIASFTGLVGEKAAMTIRNLSGDFWATAPGLPATRPARRDSSGGRTYDIMPDGTRLITTEVALRGAPWFVVLQVPEESILSRPRSEAARLTVFGALLAALGALLAWGVSRRITRPLHSLDAAVRSLGEGEYTRRAEVEGDDEIGRLAAAFNRMVDELEASRRQLEQRTRDAESARIEAERSNRAKADFLAVMSHELRTPLNAISGYSELLRIGVYGDLTTQQLEALARIENNQRHLLVLISDVLSFAKIDAGQVEYVMRDLPVNDALAAVEPLIAPQLRAKALHFDSPVCDPSLRVHVDPNKLQQVLLNLLANAVKFTPAGGLISVAVDASADHVRIHVRDTGPGIPSGRLGTIFDPFDQGDRALNKPHEGVGLGLAIARDLARGMGGDITVESEIDKGSTFTVTLVRAPEPGLAGPPSTTAGERREDAYA